MTRSARVPAPSACSRKNRRWCCSTRPMTRWNRNGLSEQDARRRSGSAPFRFGLEMELSKMTPEDRAEFEAEMGVGGADRDSLVRKIMEVSGQRLFVTAGEKEVRTWMLRKGGTALEAGGFDPYRPGPRFHPRRGDEPSRTWSVSAMRRDVKAKHLVRQEPKDYVIQDDDVLLIRFSV